MVADQAIGHWSLDSQCPILTTRYPGSDSPLIPVLFHGFSKVTADSHQCKLKANQTPNITLDQIIYKCKICSVILMISSHSSEKQVMLGNSESKTDDVIALEIEVKGSTEPFQLLLEPYVIIIPGENFIGVNVKKTFKVCLLLTLCCCSMHVTRLHGRNGSTYIAVF